MSDELTPEEKAAFEGLPRERMPAGLEAKVVDAMRDHGFLAKRRRVIELGRGRVAGVLAASVALVMVAYSVGLHRGQGREMIIPTETLTTPEPGAGRYNELGVPPAVGEAEKDQQTEKPAVDAVESREMKKEQAPPAPEASALRADESVEQVTDAPSWTDEKADAAPKLSRSSALDLRAKRVEEEQSAAPAEGTMQPMLKTSRRPAAGLDSAARPQAPASRVESFSVAEPRQTLTFNWDGQTFQLEADSVRVFEDQWGRTLHIYTSDGVIRIRLAE